MGSHGGTDPPARAAHCFQDTDIGTTKNELSEDRGSGCSAFRSGTGRGLLKRASARRSRRERLKLYKSKLQVFPQKNTKNGAMQGDTPCPGQQYVAQNIKGKRLAR